MKLGARWLIAGALALAPVSVAFSQAGVAATPSPAPQIPWCCQVRSNLNEKPTLPPLPGARPQLGNTAGRRFRRGRYSGLAMRKTPRPGCFHCGRPEAITRMVAGAARRFCSEACYLACRDLYQANMGHLYNAATPPGARLAEETPFALPGFAEAYVQQHGEVSQVSLIVEGLHCGACVWLIERSLQRVPGLLDCHVALTSGRARVSWQSARAELKDILAAVARAGYSARPYDTAVAEDPMRAVHRHWLLRMGVAGLGALATMFVSEPLYYGQLVGEAAIYGHALRYAGMVFATASGAYAGLPFFKGAWAGLCRKQLGMDALITLGIAATWIASVAGFVTGGAVYFDSLTMFVFLLILGRYAESAARRKVFASTENLLGRQVPFARVREDGRLKQVPVGALAVGDLVEVLPGDIVPADAVLESGATSVNEAMLTGESRPVPKLPGSTLTGGTLNLEGAAVLRLTRVGEETTFARLERMVAEAEGGDTRVQRLADRAGHWGTLGVAATALAALLGWWLVDAARAVPAMAAVLIITCPCALGLATPAALTLAVGEAFRRGLLFKRGETLEDLLAVKRVVLDKTGTLTLGEPEVIELLGPEPDVLQLAALLEAGSEHPIARAVLRAAEARGIAPGALPEGFTAHAGRGVSALVAGKPARAGRAEWLAAEGCEIPADWRAVGERWMAQGRTLLWVAQGQRVLGAIALADTLRPEAAEVVKALQARGIGITLLTGDNRGAAEAVASTLGITDVVAEVLPEEKLAMVRELQARHGRVAMVGDGMNDAPALAAADVGVAIARGADLAVTSADVVLLGNRLAALPEAFVLAERTFRVIRHNFVLSALYNAIAVPLAVCGLVTPLLAAILMPASSLAVLANTLRLRR